MHPVQQLRKDKVVISGIPCGTVFSAQHWLPLSSDVCLEMELGIQSFYTINNTYRDYMFPFPQGITHQQSH